MGASSQMCKWLGGCRRKRGETRGRRASETLRMFKRNWLAYRTETAAGRTHCEHCVVAPGYLKPRMHLMCSWALRSSVPAAHTAVPTEALRGAFEPTFTRDKPSPTTPQSLGRLSEASRAPSCSSAQCSNMCAACSWQWLRLLTWLSPIKEVF